jgi:hypothetical protein
MPALRISRRAADRLRAGHLWVYRTDLELDTAAQQPAPLPGSLVTIEDHRGKPQATALYSSASQIAARVVSTDPSLTRPQYIDGVRAGLVAALGRRTILAPLDAATTAQRLVFSEADSLPGIVLDRYGPLVVLQLLIQGTAQEDVRAAIVETLRAHLAPNGEPLTLWERPDPRIRELEQLDAPAPGALFSNQPQPESTTHFALNGLRFAYDINAGQKTGAFLDQRLNYAAAAAHVAASGRTSRALDICTRFATASPASISPTPPSKPPKPTSSSTPEHSQTPLSIGSRPTPSTFFAPSTTPTATPHPHRRFRSTRASYSTPSSSTRPPSPNPAALSKALCAATKSSTCARCASSLPRHAHHLLLLASRLAAGVHRSPRCGRLRRQPPRPAPRNPRRRSRSPRSPHTPRDALSQVPHLPRGVDAPVFDVGCWLDSSRR